MKSFIFLLAFIAMSTSVFAQHTVLGQSPRSAKIYNAPNKEHVVLGQSPRSAKIYTSSQVHIATTESIIIENQKSNHLVLGQSPRSAKVMNSRYVPTHIVLGQSPRSAMVYNTEGYELWKYRYGINDASLKSIR
jgi:hypothetical protein